MIDPFIFSGLHFHDKEFRLCLCIGQWLGLTIINLVQFVGNLLVIIKLVVGLMGIESTGIIIPSVIHSLVQLNLLLQHHGRKLHLLSLVLSAVLLMCFLHHWEKGLPDSP